MGPNVFASALPTVITSAPSTYQNIGLQVLSTPVVNQNSGYYVPPAVKIEQIETRPDINNSLVNSIGTVNSEIDLYYRYKCRLCGKNFNLADEYASHLQSDHSDVLRKITKYKPKNPHKILASTDHVCRICSKNLASEFNYSVHLNIHLPENTGKYACKECDKTFEYPSRLDMHVTTVHTVEKPFSCEVCGKSFKAKNILYTHVATHTNNTMHSCDSCGKSFKKEYSLAVHKFSCMRSTEGVKCSQCGKDFLNDIELNKHFVTVHKRNFPCKECDQIFTTLHLYRKHCESEHRNSEKHTCSVCKKVFTQPCYLRLHYKKVHLKDTKSEMCDICGKIVTGSVVHHRLTHSSDKTFVCEVCGKSFHNKRNLSFHERSHRGEKKYKCKTCGKYFTQKSTLNIHVRIHTGEKPYKCELCVAGFISRSLLNAHKRSKHEVAK